jgi:hypothetical protein
MAGRLALGIDWPNVTLGSAMLKAILYSFVGIQYGFS